MTLTAGAGGTEAADWCGMLTRAYHRFAKRLGLSAQLLEAGVHAASRDGGLDHATLRLAGENAATWFAAEAGVHRLTRVSPYDARRRKHTTFTAVTLAPEAEGGAEVRIDPREVRLDVFRASGPGGQGVNTTDSAVRLTYRPGTSDELAVSSQASRSQLENRDLAWKALRAKLLERERRRRETAQRREWEGQAAAAWGGQVRSYKLDRGYVLDHRTGVWSTDPAAVLAGGLEAFAMAWLRRERGRGGA